MTPIDTTNHFKKPKSNEFGQWSILFLVCWAIRLLWSHFCCFVFVSQQDLQEAVDERIFTTIICHWWLPIMFMQLNCWCEKRLVHQVLYYLFQSTALTLMTHTLTVLPGKTHSQIMVCDHITYCIYVESILVFAISMYLLERIKDYSCCCCCIHNQCEGCLYYQIYATHFLAVYWFSTKLINIRHRSNNNVQCFFQLKYRDLDIIYNFRATFLLPQYHNTTEPYFSLSNLPAIYRNYVILIFFLLYCQFMKTDKCNAYRFCLTNNWFYSAYVSYHWLISRSFGGFSKMQTGRMTFMPAKDLDFFV